MADNSSRCIQHHGGLIALRRSSTGQFNSALDFTHVVRDLDRVYAIRVPSGEMCESWMEDLVTFGLAHPRLSVMERIAPSFKFFLNAQLPAGEAALELVPVIRGVIRLFGFAANECAVLRDTDDAACHRYVWPDVCVNASRAYVLRERVIAELSANDTGDHVCSYRWADVFDGKMYEPCLPGPAFPGSAKFTLCMLCQNKAATRRECACCMLRGVVLSPGVMMPLAVIQFDAEGSFSCVPGEPHLGKFLIHSDVPISNDWIVPSGTPFCPFAATSPVPVGWNWKSRKKYTDVSKDIQILLQRVIRATHAAFSRLVVTERSVYIPSSDKFVVHPVGIGSTSCIQFRSDHLDSIVFFVITPRGVAQRCYSSEVVLCGNECKHRESQCSPLDEVVINRLFPRASGPPTNISNSTQSSAYQLACRISDYHTNIIRGGVGRKRNVYGDVNRPPSSASSSKSKRNSSGSRDEH